MSAPRRLPKTALSLLLSAALLTACAAPEPRLLVDQRVERLTAPPQLLTCLESPEPPIDMPGGPAITQADVADYLISLWDAGQDCRDKLSALRALLGG